MFANNIATNVGGAIAVCLINIIIEESAMLSFNGNKAKYTGGAIFIL